MVDVPFGAGSHLVVAGPWLVPAWCGTRTARVHGLCVDLGVTAGPRWKDPSALSQLRSQGKDAVCPGVLALGTTGLFEPAWTLVGIVVIDHSQILHQSWGVIKA